MARRLRKVSMKELESIWNSLQKQGICFNGCTHAALVKKYGEQNLLHKMGVGWYKLTDK